MNHKKKLLIFESLPNIAGGQKVLLNLLPYLKEEFELTVVLPGAGELQTQLAEIGVATIFINPGSYSLGQKNIGQVFKYFFFLLLFFSRTLFLIKKFDLLYVNSARVLPMVVLANFLSQRPIIWHNHSLISDQKSLALVELAAKQKSVRQIIAVSQFIVSHNDKLKNKTAVIYNGVDQNIFYPKISPAARDEKNKIIQIGVIGDLIPTKGQDQLLLALASLHSKKWHLQIIGGSRPDNDNFARELQSLTANLKLSDQVVFLGRQEKVADYLRELDLFILPSIVAEACPLVILEALACGVPVIAADLGGTRELIREAYNGYLFRARDQRDLAEKIKQFFELDSEKIKQLSLNCRREAAEKYSLAENAGQIYQLIKTILN